LISYITGHRPQKPLCLIIGNFDGIHLGHQSLLKRACELAATYKCEAALLQFDPHPMVFFSNTQRNELIQTQEQTIRLLKHFGVSHLLSLQFNHQTAALSPESFLTFLVDQLEIKHIIVGNNFRFGRKRSGDTEMLKELAEKNEINAHICSHIQDYKGVISSTRVRNAIKCGDMKAAASLLGRLYFMGGVIIKGIQKGREMGTPTANLKPQNLLLPKSGVYATWICLDGIWHPSITHIGQRPTRGKREFGIETHLLDMNLNCYGKKVLLAFTHFLRDEMVFSGFDALQSQIQIDIQNRKNCDDFQQKPALNFIDCID